MSKRSIIIDTNILLDLILKREPNYSKNLSIFNNCESNQIEIIILKPVILEFEWVLRSFYKIPREKLVEYLWGLVDSFSIDQKLIVETAVNLYQLNQSISFTDAVIISEAKLTYPLSDFLTEDASLRKIFLN